MQSASEFDLSPTFRRQEKVMEKTQLPNSGSFFDTMCLVSLQHLGPRALLFSEATIVV